MLHDLRNHHFPHTWLAPAMGLITESQTLHPRFKSVTDEIMKNSLQFIRLQTPAYKTLGTTVRISTPKSLESLT